jgi:membrane fusion protein, multidrug efflux system
MQRNGNADNVLQWIVVWAILVFLAVSAGCENGDSRQRSGPPPAPEVAVVTIAPQSVPLTTELPGRTSAFRVAEIRPQVSGLIQKRLFTEGADVKAGDVLYQIDPAPFEAALANAEAALAKAKANIPAIRSKAERYRKLAVTNAISQQDYDDVAAVLKQAEAEVAYCEASVKTARINLGYTQITAPISGRIGISTVTDGAMVTAYQARELTTIQQIDPIYVDMAQSAAELHRLRRRLEAGHLKRHDEGSQQVSLILEDGTPYPMDGTLQFQDVTVDPTTGSVTLRAIFPNPDGVLLPGLFVRAVVREGIAEKAILAPQQGVSRNPKGEPVALVVDETGKVAQRILILDRAVGNQWLVTSGLGPGDRLMVEGMINVRPGMTVKAVPFEGGKADSNWGAVREPKAR